MHGIQYYRHGTQPDHFNASEKKTLISSHMKPAYQSYFKSCANEHTTMLHDIIWLALTMDCINVNLYFNGLKPQFIENRGKTMLLLVGILRQQHRLLSTSTPLTCNNSTLAAKTLFSIILSLNLKVLQNILPKIL